MSKFTPERFEPIIFKMAMTSTKHAAIILDYFEKHWFQDSLMGEILEAAIKHFYAKNNKLPKRGTIELFVEKIYATKHGQSVVSKISSAYDIDLTEYDQDFLDNEFIEYLKNVGLYYTLMSSITEIEEKKSVICFDSLSKISSMSFVDNNGSNLFETHEEFINETRNPIARTSTGWAEMDRTTGGLPTNGRCFFVFAAKPGGCKSLMLSNLAANYLKQGKFVIIFSLEMSEYEYKKRIYGHLTGMTINDFGKNADELDRKFKDVKAQHSDGILIVKEFAPNTVNCNTMSVVTDKLIQQYCRKPDLILIDYVALVNPNDANKSDNTYSAQGKVTKDMRAMSYKYECPVGSAAQLNRGNVEAVEPKIDGLADSMGVGHNADLIGCLYDKEGDRENGIKNLIWVKNRLSGYLGVIQFDIDYKSCTISDLDGHSDNVTEKEIMSIMQDIDGLNSIEA